MNKVHKPFVRGWGWGGLMSKYIEASEKEDPEETGSLMPWICHQDTTWCLCLICSDVAAPCQGLSMVDILQMFLELKVVAIFFGSFEFLLFVA